MNTHPNSNTASHTAVIDNGYFSTITFQQDPTLKLFSFRSKIQESPIPLSFHHTHHLTLNSKSYLIGEGAETQDINLDKSTSQLHYLTTLTALSLLGSGSYNLIANIPLNLFNKNNKEAFETHLRTTNPINLTLNSKPIIISIPNVIVFPQTFPVLYCNKTPSTIGILDIGGLTAQAVISQNLNIIPSTICSENLGTIPLMQKIKKSLNSNYSLNLQDFEMEQIMKNGLPNKSESLKIIDSICKQHVDQIIKTLTLTGWNLQSTPILLTGGGSLLLESYLSKVLPQYKMSLDPINDNCKGLWEITYHVFKK